MWAWVTPSWQRFVMVEIVSRRWLLWKNKIKLKFCVLSCSCTVCIIIWSAGEPLPRHHVAIEYGAIRISTWALHGDTTAIASYCIIMINGAILLKQSSHLNVGLAIQLLLPIMYNYLIRSNVYFLLVSGITLGQMLLKRFVYIPVSNFKKA